jgi:hypothetical protein
MLSLPAHPPTRGAALTDIGVRTGIAFVLVAGLATAAIPRPYSLNATFDALLQTFVA